MKNIKVSMPNFDSVQSSKDMSELWNKFRKEYSQARQNMLEAEAEEHRRILEAMQKDIATFLGNLRGKHVSLLNPSIIYKTLGSETYHVYKRASDDISKAYATLESVKYDLIREARKGGDDNIIKSMALTKEGRIRVEDIKSYM